MKAPEIIGRLIVGCVFACCLTSSKLHAQILPPPNTNAPPAGTNTVDWAAIEAAQQAQFAQDYLPWLQQDESLLYVSQGYVSQSVNASGQSIFTADEKEAIRIANLNSLSAANQAQLDAEQAEIQAYLATNAIPTTIQSSRSSRTRVGELRCFSGSEAS